MLVRSLDRFFASRLLIRATCIFLFTCSSICSTYIELHFFLFSFTVQRRHKCAFYVLIRFDADTGYFCDRPGGGSDELIPADLQQGAIQAGRRGYYLRHGRRLYSHQCALHHQPLAGRSRAEKNGNASALWNTVKSSNKIHPKLLRRTLAAHSPPAAPARRETSLYSVQPRGIRAKVYKMIPRMIFTILNISTFSMRKAVIDFELIAECP